MKELIIVRHGQAQHNPRAEAAHQKGCSMEDFLALMREDDVLDARLTEFGKQQAIAARLAPALATSIQLVASSTLSRAIETADHVLPPPTSTSSYHHTRVCTELFREVSGDMLNVKRRSRTELIKSFPDWNFEEVEEDDDTLWNPTMENLDNVAERGYLGLKWLMERPEEKILLVSHGGILKYMMERHPLIVIKDGRSNADRKAVDSRFDNCELRSYRLSWTDGEVNGNARGRSISLTQVDDHR